MILVWTFAATLGFAVLFEVRGWALAAAAAAGTLGWAVYLAFDALGAGLGPSNAAAAAAVTAVAEMLARHSHRPLLTFLAPALIPLVPGRALYTAMDRAVGRDLTAAGAAGWETLVIAASLVVGVAAVSLAARRWK